MKIILEGPDNSGKSTLARHLSSVLCLPIVPGEGPGRSVADLEDRLQRYAAIDDAIFDRHPAISQPIYNGFRKGYGIDPALIADFYQQDILIIYCVGRPSLEGQVVKEYDHRTDANGQPHYRTVEEHHLDICRAYDEWARDHAHAIYRIGDDPSMITRIASSACRPRFDPVGDIGDFHRKFGLEYDGPPRVLPPDLSRFRIKFMDEELAEYAEHEAAASAIRYIDHSPDSIAYADKLNLMLDALVDEVYVVLGTAYLHGFDFREAWRRVHAANMRKVRAERASDSKRGSTFDVIKPEGWEAPSHIDLCSVNDINWPHGSSALSPPP